MSKSAVKPTIGRVVIYVWPEEEIKKNNFTPVSPAVIVNTFEHTSYENSEVNLKVLSDGVNNVWATSVPYSETKEPSTWHWPPRD